MLGERLKEMRLARRESLIQVADAISASKAHIWDLERSRSKNPSLELLRKLASHFDTTISYLIEDSASGDEPRADRFINRNRRKLAVLSHEDLYLVERMIDRLSNAHPILIGDGNLS